MAFDIQKKSLKNKNSAWGRHMESAPQTKKFARKLGTSGARKIAKQHLIQEIREAH